MFKVLRWMKGGRVVVDPLRTLRVNHWKPTQIDPEGLRYVATLSVRIHWFTLGVLIFLLFYRSPDEVTAYSLYGLILMALVGFTLYIYYRLRANRGMTWPLILSFWTVDLAAVSAAVVVGGGFSHYFFYLYYYPALAAFAIVFGSFSLNMAWVTLVSAIYVAISLSVGDGLDIEARDEKPLLARIAVMYTVVALINLVSEFERNRWRESVGRERWLQQERAEISQTIHDTTAQSVYMIGLGIETAKQLAGDRNAELITVLDETSQLSRGVIWELRSPITIGRIYEGRELSRVLRSHTASFTNITSVPAELTCAGKEPHLSVETRRLLFSIAHNALTNAYRHGEASRVAVDLEFGDEEIRLSVSDDGLGLPDAYADRGHGFANMTQNARRLGGRLVVQRRGPMGGAAVTCLMPAPRG